jgi:hypothetical protein
VRLRVASLVDDREQCRLIWNYAIDVWLDETNLDDVPEGIAQLSYLISYFSMAAGGASITTRTNDSV